jgi:diamine N-acetyltransferase
MFLKGKIISIRALEPADADLLYRWENNISVWPVSLTQIPFSRFVLEDFVNSAHQDIYTNKQLRLMITLNAGNETVGIVDLFEFEPRHARCGLGIYVDGSHRRKGLALESIGMIRDYCFSILHLKQVYAHINNSNTPSLQLFQKAGFDKVALKKSWNKTGLNSFEDVWFMQCLNKG